MLNKDQLGFTGHISTSEGLKPQGRKVETATQMKEPENVEAVLRRRGMVNYLARFLPKLSSVMEPIRRLTQLDVEWKCLEEKMKLSEKSNILLQVHPYLGTGTKKKN